MCVTSLQIVSNRTKIPQIVEKVENMGKNHGIVFILQNRGKYDKDDCITTLLSALKTVQSSFIK